MKKNWPDMTGILLLGGGGHDCAGGDPENLQALGVSDGVWTNARAAGQAF